MKPGDTSRRCRSRRPRPASTASSAASCAPRITAFTNSPSTARRPAQPIDFYNPEVKPTKEIDLGVFDLKQGDNEFTATVTGANRQSRSRATCSVSITCCSSQSSKQLTLCLALPGRARRPCRAAEKARCDVLGRGVLSRRACRAELIDYSWPNRSPRLTSGIARFPWNS